MDWAVRHHGVLTRAAARSAGLTDRQIRHRVAAGRWVAVRTGAWVPAGMPVSPLVELTAAALCVDATVSHASASWSMGLLELPPREPELSVELGRGHHHEGVRLHRTDDLLGRDTVMHRGLRTTNAIRTCIDMGARLGPRELERLIERARHRGLVHLDPLVARFLQLARPGRDGIATVRTVLCSMDPALEPAESDLETLLTRLLVEHGLDPPTRQHPVEIDGRRFRIDVCYPAQRLAIESDGFADHGLRAAFEHDRERQNLLVLDGWTVLRFTWRQVCERPDWVASQVRRALAAVRDV